MRKISMHESSNENLIPGSFRQFNILPELFRSLAKVALAQQRSPIFSSIGNWLFFIALQ
jgi:hypothetical protein